MAEPLLVVDDIYSGYGRIEVLHGVSFSIAAGEIVAMIGANGAGKSSALMCVSGINRVRQGSVRFDGAVVASPHSAVARGLAQVPEGRKIFPRMTVMENLRMGGYLQKDREKLNGDLERVLTLFPILRDRREQLGGTLSGGEQQMLAIGRALMSRPKLLLLDEPSMGIAPLIVLKIFEIIREINQQGVTVLLVEQNAHLALKLASRAYVMETGRIVLSDTCENLLGNAKIRDAYLGTGT